MTDKEKILAALRGARPESEAIDLGGDVRVTLRVVPVDRKDELRAQAQKDVPDDAEARDERVFGRCVLRILAAALEHERVTFEDVAANLGAPVLKRLWGEYERLEAVVTPATDSELDELHEKVKAIVGESRDAAATHLSGLGYTTLLRYAISTVGRPSS